MKPRSFQEPTIRFKSGEVVAGTDVPKGAEYKASAQPFAQVRSAIASGAAEVLDEEARKKALFYELYDKVNIAQLLFKKRAGSVASRDLKVGFAESYYEERVRMVVRYVRYLQELGAGPRDYAKALAIWSGGLSDEVVQEMMPYAELISMQGDLSDMQLFSIIRDAQPPVNVSGVEWENVNFGEQSKDQTPAKDKRSRAAQSHQDDLNARFGRLNVANVYDLIKDFAPYFDDGAIDGKGLLDRSVDELFEMNEKSSQLINGVTPDFFRKVAAVLLKICGSSYINFVRDVQVSTFALDIAKGATKSQIKQGLALLFRVKSDLTEK